MKKQLSVLNNIHNFTQIFLWGNVFYKTLTILLLDNSSKSDDIETILTSLRLVQTLQLFDILFNVLKVTSGSLFGSMAQVLARLIVTWCILDENTPFKTLAAVLIPWSISDIVRYSFYLSHNKLTGFLRYNLFLVLYPAGVIGELLSIEDKIKVYGSYLRVLQATIVFGLIFLYQMMLNNRKRYNHKKMH
jgi:very-long-chain (3R)-3-hydroxyacyl-CoA dehydratase